VVAAATTFVIGEALRERAGAQPPLGPGLVTVDLDIRYSEFALDTVHVRPGTTVRFVLDNQDPINHEFVVGDAAVHARHQAGTERAHPPVPGEVSLPPHRAGVTFYEFSAPGEFEYACHLPGHLAYGMRGKVVVTDT
jgi:uncharacterized cupredoxin-like copper-binding protein